MVSFSSGDHLKESSDSISCHSSALELASYRVE
jgi:hypothetical protein